MTTINHFEDSIRHYLIWIWSVENPQIFLSSQFLNSTFPDVGF